MTCRFVAAFATLSALILFPVSTEDERAGTTHSYGSGYIMSWACVLMYALCALLLSLDDIVRCMARGFPCCQDDSRRL